VRSASVAEPATTILPVRLDRDRAGAGVAAQHSRHPAPIAEATVDGAAAREPCNRELLAPSHQCASRDHDRVITLQGYGGKRHAAQRAGFDLRFPARAEAGVEFAVLPVSDERDPVDPVGAAVADPSCHDDPAVTLEDDAPYPPELGSSGPRLPERRQDFAAAPERDVRRPATREPAETEGAPALAQIRGAGKEQLSVRLFSEGCGVRGYVRQQEAAAREARVELASGCVASKR
jgi:hypothetical protein